MYRETHGGQSQLACSQRRKPTRVFVCDGSCVDLNVDEIRLNRPDNIELAWFCLCVLNDVYSVLTLQKYPPKSPFLCFSERVAPLKVHR